MSPDYPSHGDSVHPSNSGTPDVTQVYLSKTGDTPSTFVHEVDTHVNIFMATGSPSAATHGSEGVNADAFAREQEAKINEQKP